MSRMYDALGLLKRYPLESLLTPKDKETIRICYRDAMCDVDRHSGFNDPIAAEARGRMHTLEAIFGLRMFLDLYAEKYPCPYRKRIGEGTYTCKLAEAEMKRLGKRGYYDTECRHLWGAMQRPNKQKIQTKQTIEKMSHFVTMVIGDDPEAQLAPYSESLEVEEYCVEKVSDHDKQRMLDYYNENREQPYTSFDKCYADNGEDWNRNEYRKNEAGEWCEYSTYNPESKWDWYLLGGRWSGQILIMKEGATTGIVGEPAWCSKTRGIDAARKKDIDFEAMYRKEEAWAPYAVVKDGKWYARGRMGWWGVSHDDMPDDEWVAKVQELIERLPDDVLVSIYDCHI